ncbi:MAG: amino acid ABC transporter permease [Acidimicrobiia bacterium]
MTSETLPLERFPQPLERAVGWVRENLFSTVWNGVLTAVVGIGAVWLVASLVRWALFSADWAVVLVNSKLYMVGRYPGSEVWRVWVAVLVVAALGGLSWGRAAGRLRARALTRDWARWSLVIGVVFAAVLYAAAWDTRAAILATAPTVLIGRQVGSRFTGRRAGRALLGLWLMSYIFILVLLGGTGAVGPELWGGVLLTLLLTINGIALAFPLGVLLALGRASSFPAFRWLSVLYIELIRGVPLVTILFSAWLLFPLFVPTDVQVPLIIRAQAGIIAFSAAYVAENVRGGLQAIPTGQYDAARALGLSPLRVTGLIVLPQALRAVIPALVGQFISLFKDTSLVFVLGLLELLTVAQAVTSQAAFRGDQRESLLFAALLYWIVAFSMSRWSQRLEQRLGVGER